MPEEKKLEEKTSIPQASKEEEKPNDSELGSGQFKSVEELEQEVNKLKDTLYKAEFTIKKLKKEPKELVDINAIKTDVLNEVNAKLEPKLQSLEKLNSLEKENRELRETLTSQKNITNVGSGASETIKENKPVPTEHDIKVAQKVGMAIDDYMKFKPKN
jgi:hypothetical protein